ncbi:unnamed protein product [Haemonchus placei]|uniref:Replicative DNA helicase n=1 Tax=Haemonchus placei TaxID=6290 RepID=A0A0N4X9V0_HAEPC|nr:unnamed protein product [Haemonchus placei]
MLLEADYDSIGRIADENNKVAVIHERLKDCDDNIKSAGYLLEYSAITASVLQLSAEQLRFDPDVNEFERDVAILMLKDPQLTYTGETMHRQIKTKTKEDGKVLLLRIIG